MHSKLKETMVGGVPTGSGPVVVSRVSATVRGLGAAEGANAAELAVVDWGGTLDAAAAGLKLNDASPLTASVAERTTVLPRRKKMPEAETAQRLRFDRVRVLGQGAMGQVELARDNDIRRTVAVKRMIGETMSAEALLRFADEIRVVGQLEHPGIVPIYDVGRDANGEVYLVMKHLQGETMEDVIDKLREGDRDYLERFPIEFRVHLFLQVLDAVRYAHARGILHRDLKPANIQIGPFGEVTVMDWGIAKPFTPAQQSSDVQPLEKTLLESQGRLLETQFGSLAGTPLYMSPEQASGRNDELDARSDVYALCVVLFEWLTLQHPLKNKGTITEVLAAIISQDLDQKHMFEAVACAGMPMEYLYIVNRGLQRDRTKRTKDVETLENELKRVLDGHIEIKCHVTFAKSTALGFANWLDRNPRLFSLMLLCVLVAVLLGLGLAAWRLLAG
ncbi:MAG TPA: serine/threonine-protein kinase [Polyangiaceae bacterium]|nr:serine/threonine-protein kinase [Polyangiaceae bacterium]